MRTLQNISFWRKFRHYLLIGLSALVLFAGVQSGMVGDFTQRGPDQVLADEDVCGGPDQLGCPNPGYDGGEFPLPQPPAIVPSQSAPPSTVCTEVRNTPYGQCGGTVGLEGRDPTHQFEVVRITDSCSGGILRYEVTRDAGSAGACGFQPPPPPPPPPGPGPRGPQYSACGISGQLWDASVGGNRTSLQPGDCGSNQYLHVYPPDANGYVTNGCENIPPGGVKNSDGCGWHQVAAPVTTTPTTPVSTCDRREVDEGCTDNGFRSFRTIDTCSGFSSARRVWDSACIRNFNDTIICQESVTASFCSSQSFRTERVINSCNNMGEFTRTVWDSNCGFFQSSFCTPTEIFSSDTCVGNGTRQRVFTNSCTGGEMRRERFFDSNCLVSGPIFTQPVITQPVVTQPVVQQPTVVRFATLDAACPAGSTRTVDGNVVTCTVTAPATFGNVGVARVITAQAPAVAGVKELPKTGLPLLAWAALAFIPAGFKIRGFSKIKEETSAKPHFLYEERQFKTLS